MDELKHGTDALFVMLGAIMVLAMHSGFAFLELGTVRQKNQVNALVKILVDFSVSTIAYFFIGYGIAYGVLFMSGAEVLAEKNGFELVKFFFLLTFAAAIPAIVSGGIAERARFNPQLAASSGRGLHVPALRRHRMERPLRHAGLDQGHDRRRFPRLCRRWSCTQWVAGSAWSRSSFSVPGRPLSEGWRHHRAPALEHSVSRTGRLDPDGWLVRLQRDERADARQDLGPGGDEFVDGDGRRHARGHAVGQERPGFRLQRPARRPGRRLRRLGRDAPGRRAGHGRRGRWIFVALFTLAQNRWKIDDVLGVWPLHGLCGAWGGIACGIFGLQAFGGMGGVARPRNSSARARRRLGPGRRLHHLWRAARTMGLRLTAEEEYDGADLSIHKIGATPEREANW